MGEWDEWWLDIKTPKCITNVQSVMAARIQAAHDKGCDGVDPDNVDAYANEVSYGVPFGITDTDQVNYLKSVNIFLKYEKNADIQVVGYNCS